MWKILRNFSKKRENHKDDSFKEKIMSCRNQEISMDAVMNNLFLSNDYMIFESEVPSRSIY